MLEASSSNSYTKIPSTKNIENNFESTKYSSHVKFQPLKLIQPESQFDTKYFKWMVIISIFLLINTIFLWAIFQYT